MRVLRFQTRLPNGQVEQLNVENERVLVGSGAHCDIRLPLGEARVEHVLIELGPAGVFARALSFEPPPTINNVPFTQAPLPPGAVLGVTGTQIFIEVFEGDGAGAAGDTAKEKKSNRLGIIAMCIIVPGAGFLFLAPDEIAGGDPIRPTPPELWNPPVTACPERDRGQAAGLAREKMAIADAKRERRPFHVQDGVSAVPIYEVAAVCFQYGGDPRDARTATLADESAKYLRREMNDDFRMRRVRLEHSLATEDYVSALKDVRVLLQFVEGKSGEYVTWLSNLNRKLKLKVGSEGAK